MNTNHNLYLTVSTLALVLFPQPGPARKEKNHYSQLVSILKIAYYYLALLAAIIFYDQQRENEHLRC